jgi:hypothetical protein
LLAQTLPLTPGSRVVRRCSFEMGVGSELGPIMSRRMLMVRAVRRSHFELVDERESECQRAVLRMKGALGTRSLRRAEGEDSMVATAGARFRPGMRSAGWRGRSLGIWRHDYSSGESTCRGPVGLGLELT